MWWTVLISVINLLLTWWVNRQKSGRQAPAWAIKATDHVIARVEQMKVFAIPMGCGPSGKLMHDGEELHVSNEADPFQNDPEQGILTDRVYRLIISNVVVPKLRQKAPGLPGKDDEWTTFIISQIQD